MKEFKKNNYRFWHSPVALGIIFLILVVSGFKIIDLVKKERDTAHEKEIVLDQLAGLKKREDALNNNISKLETEEGKEEIIREKWPVVKEGEKMVTVVTEGKKIDSGTTGANTNHGFWNWIKKIFGIN
jgi:cell division protein FtsB